MRSAIRTLLVVGVLLWCSQGIRAQGGLAFAELGDYRLENGQVIRHCRLAYRTFGALNADKSNAVLFPTWLAGTTQELVELGYIGPGKVVDSSKFFVVAVEAFGNGISSSPSNSRRQHGRSFPRFSVRDLVAAQHLLLTRQLQLPHLRGVVGISLGGMVAYQWLVTYPDFLDKAVAIAGSPRLTSYDRLLWQAELDALGGFGKKRPDNAAAMRRVAVIHNLHARTPGYVAAHTPPEAFPQYLAAVEQSLQKYDATDWAWQLGAVMDHDVYRSCGGSPAAAAKVIRAQVLVVWSRQDLAICPEPALALASCLGAETCELPGDCGHFSFLCEIEALRDRVGRFLE